MGWMRAVLTKTLQERFKSKTHTKTYSSPSNMVAPIFNETILVVVDPHDCSARRRSAGSIVARASLTGFNHADFTILKDTFESWGKGELEDFHDILVEKKTSRAAIVIQKTLRGWMTRQRLRTSQLVSKLASMESEKKFELRLIQQEKQLRMRRMRKEVELELQNRFQEEEATLMQAQDIIQRLKQENAAIRKANQHIQDEMNELYTCNERLYYTYKRAAHSLEEISTIVQNTSQKVAALQQEEADLINEIQDTVAAIHIYDDAIKFERAMGSRYNKCLGTIFEELKKRQEACVPELRTHLIECIEHNQECHL